MKLFLAAGALLATVSIAYAGTDFSCPYGKQGACLDYNDNVCSFMAKCVPSNAVCFDSFTCDYRGFVCKSDLEDVVSTAQTRYDELQSKYNRLVDDYNTLLDTAKQAQDDLNGGRDFKRCVSGATSLSEAQECRWSI